MVMVDRRSTSPRMPGMLRHPSSKELGLPVSVIFWALMNTFFSPCWGGVVLGSSSSSIFWVVSITNRRMGSPIWGAASPTPLALYMVSHMLVTSSGRFS